MKKIIAAGIFVLFCTGTIASISCSQGTGAKAQNGMMVDSPELKLKLAMRKLWEEHTVYKRNYIISTLANIEDTRTVGQRLLSNQNDIGNIMKQYYGNATGDKLTVLLREHISIITEILKVAKIKTDENLDSVNKKWYANAQEIANFLSEINPNWGKKYLNEILNDHLNLTAGQIVSRLKKDWLQDISCYDRSRGNMVIFADFLTEGIVRQFPDKFK